ncbi:hypothetical protein SLE2022_399370 [Rubroshorea leprosula]
MNLFASHPYSCSVGFKFFSNLSLSFSDASLFVPRLFLPSLNHLMLPSSVFPRPSSLRCQLYRSEASDFPPLLIFICRNL